MYKYPYPRGITSIGKVFITHHIHTYIMKTKTKLLIEGDKANDYEYDYLDRLANNILILMEGNTIHPKLVEYIEALIIELQERNDVVLTDENEERLGL